MCNVQATGKSSARATRPPNQRGHPELCRWSLESGNRPAREGLPVLCRAARVCGTKCCLVGAARLPSPARARRCGADDRRTAGRNRGRTEATSRSMKTPGRFLIRRQVWSVKFDGHDAQDNGLSFAMRYRTALPDPEQSGHPSSGHYAGTQVRTTLNTGPAIAGAQALGRPGCSSPAPARIEAREWRRRLRHRRNAHRQPCAPLLAASTQKAAERLGEAAGRLAHKPIQAAAPPPKARKAHTTSWKSLSPQSLVPVLCALRVCAPNQGRVKNSSSTMLRHTTGAGAESSP